jgi:hypothetical protein
MVVGVCKRRGCSPHGEQEVESMDLGTRYILQSHTPIDLLPPTRPHPLKFPEPPKIVPPARDQTFSIETIGDISYSNLIREGVRDGTLGLVHAHHCALLLSYKPSPQKINFH